MIRDLPHVLEEIAGGRRRLDPAARGELITAADLIRKSREMLTSLEWARESDHPQGGTYPACPVCDQADPADPFAPAEHRGHAEGCELGDLIDYIRGPGAHV